MIFSFVKLIKINACIKRMNEESTTRKIVNLLPYVDKISRGFNFADDENFQFRVDLISRLRPS